MKIPLIYNYPAYYDLLFGWDRDAEASFYDRVIALNGVGDSEPILEIAVGTGQIARRLARLGHRVTGLDASSDMLDLLQQRGVAEGANVRLLHADMTDFSDAVVYGAAFNPMNSFRLLQSDAAAIAHLNAVASVLRSGGIYLLDMEFCEDLRQPAATTSESWKMSRDGVTIVATNDRIQVSDHLGRSLSCSGEMKSTFGTIRSIRLATSWVRSNRFGYPLGIRRLAAAARTMPACSWPTSQTLT